MVKLIERVVRTTKVEERALMRELAEQRQKQTPERHDPDWVAAYWLRKGLLA